MTQDELNTVIRNHKLYIDGNGGAVANLHGADLRGLDLHEADLSCADLSNADLRGANMMLAVYEDFPTAERNYKM